MKFCEHRSSVDFMAKELGNRQEARLLTLKAYQECLEKGDTVSANQFLQEEIWDQAKRPYYLVYPTVIPLLTRIELDFSGESVKFPPHLQTLAVRFPENQTQIVTKDGSPLRSMLVAPVDMRPSSQIRYPGRGLAIWMDIGETLDSEGMSLPLYDYAIFPLDSRTIQECLEVCPQGDSGKKVNISSGWANQAIRLVITLLLIQDDPNLINPDVLGKDEAALLEALRKEDASRIQVLQDRAFRRRGPGWEIGKRYEPNSGPYVVPPHPQRYWVGKGRTQVVVKTRKGYVVDRDKITKIPSGFVEQ